MITPRDKHFSNIPFISNRFINFAIFRSFRQRAVAVWNIYPLMKNHPWLQFVRKHEVGLNGTCGKRIYRLRVAISTTTPPYVWRNTVTSKRNHGIIDHSNNGSSRQQQHVERLARIYPFDCSVVYEEAILTVRQLWIDTKIRRVHRSFAFRFRLRRCRFTLPCIERISWNMDEYIGLSFYCSTTLNY